MEIKELLREIGLNKYESASYEVILKRGIVEANVISKEGNIPFGKIYEALESLHSKGLIEIQNTRPKKYKIKNPKIAFQKILERKTKESEQKLKGLRETLIQIEEKISAVHTQKTEGKTFWTTAIGEEIEEMMGSIFSDAKKEILMIPYVINKSNHTKYAMLNFSKLVNEIEKSLKRGVNLRIILPQKFLLNELSQLKLKKLKKVKIRTIKGLSFEPFTLIDKEKTILRISDPIERKRILAMVKIIDANLSRHLAEKFEKLWKNAKEV